MTTLSSRPHANFTTFSTMSPLFSGPAFNPGWQVAFSGHASLVRFHLEQFSPLTGGTGLSFCNMCFILGPSSLSCPDLDH